MKIIFVGASGVGKSTLVEKFLKDNPGYYRPPSFSRPMNSKLGFPLNEDCTNESQYATTAFMAWQIISHEDLIYDRGIVDCLSYTKSSRNISKKQYKKHKNDFIEVLKDKDIVHFYIPIEFLTEDDGVRSLDEKYRIDTDKNMLKFLKKNNIKYYELRGTVEERYSKMVEIINKLEAENLF